MGAHAGEILVWMVLAGLVGLVTGFVLGRMPASWRARRARSRPDIARWADTPSIDAEIVPAGRRSEAEVLALEPGEPEERRVEPSRESRREAKREEKRAAKRREREARVEARPVEQPAAAQVHAVASVAVQRARREAPVVSVVRAPLTAEPERLRPSEARAWRRSEPNPEPPPYEFETLRVREEPMQAWAEPAQPWDDEPDDEAGYGVDEADDDAGDELGEQPGGIAVAPARSEPDVEDEEPEPEPESEPAGGPAAVVDERPAELEPPAAVGFAGAPAGFPQVTGDGAGPPPISGVETAETWEIEDIQGIGPAYARRLRNAGVMTIGQLLEAGATQKGRKALSLESGIRRSLVMRLVSHADLLRVEGVDPMLAELLEAVGVTSPSELARRNVANLVNTLAEANRRRKIAPSTPSEPELAKIVASAHTLERVVRR